MIGKIHIIDAKKIFACCDKELIGSSFDFNGVKITISSGFYGTERISKKEILKNIEECEQVNIFGNKVCSFLLKEKIISKEQILKIQNNSHIQIYKL